MLSKHLDTSPPLWIIFIICWCAPCPPPPPPQKDNVTSFLCSCAPPVLPCVWWSGHSLLVSMCFEMSIFVYFICPAWCLFVVVFIVGTSYPSSCLQINVMFTSWRACVSVRGSLECFNNHIDVTLRGTCASQDQNPLLGPGPGPLCRRNSPCSVSHRTTKPEHQSRLSWQQQASYPEYKHVNNFRSLTFRLNQLSNKSQTENNVSMAAKYLY